MVIGTNKPWLWLGVLCAPVAMAQVEGGSGAAAPASIVVSAHQERWSSFLDGDLLDDERAWVRHPHEAPRALARTGAEVVWRSAAMPQWEWGGFVERQAWSEGSDASVQALAFANNQRVAQRDALYPFDVEFQRMRRWGVSVGHHTGFSGLQEANRWWWRAKGFVVDDYKAGRGSGALRETAVGQVGLQADVQQFELGRATPFVRPNKQLGWGWGVALGAEWAPSEAWRWRAEVKDLGPKTRLKHVLSTTTRYDTSNATYDAQGHIQYVPMVTGQYRDTSAQVDMPTQWSVSGRWQQRPGLAWVGGWSHQRPFSRWYAGAEWAVGSDRLSTALHAGSNGLPTSLGLGWRSKRYTIGWQGDAVQPSRARVWVLSGSVAF